MYDRRMYAILRLKMHAASHANKFFAIKRHELFFTLQHLYRINGQSTIRGLQYVANQLLLTLTSHDRV